MKSFTRRLRMLAVLLSLSFGFTLFAQSTLISEDFEGDLSGWEKVFTNTDPANDVVLSTDAFHAGAQAVRFSSFEAGTPYDQYLVSSEISETTNDLTMRFWYKASSAAAETFRIGWSVGGNDVNTDFTWGNDVTTTDENWAEFVKESIPAGTKHIAIHYKSENVKHLYVDDVLISEDADPANLEGYVTNSYGVPVEGVYVTAKNLDHTYNVQTIGNGQYTIEDMVPATYQVTFTYVDPYNVIVKEGVELVAGETTYLNITLTSPLVNVNPTEMSNTVNPNEVDVQTLNIQNAGNGPVDFTATVVYPEDATTVLRKDFTKTAAPEWTLSAAAFENDGIRGAGSSRAIECPEGSIYSQAPVNYENAVNSEEGSDLRVYAEFVDVSAPIGGVSFFAINAFNNGGWAACTEPNQEFSIQFCEKQADGTPGSVVADYDVEVTGVETGEMFAGSFPIYQFTASFDEMTVLQNGFLSVQGTSNPDCWFMWVDNTDAPGTGYQADDAGVMTAKDNNMGFCLTPYQGETDWLSLEDYAGTINPTTKETFELGVVYDATYLAEGVYNAQIELAFSPELDPITVPVTLTVEGSALTPITKFVAEITDMVAGTVEMTWEHSKARAFKHFQITRNGVNVNTTTEATYTETLPEFGTYTYTVQAIYDEGASQKAEATVVWEFPAMEVAPTELTTTLWPEDTTMMHMTISNDGEGVLEYTFAAAAAAELMNAADYVANDVSNPFKGQNVEVAKGENDPFAGKGNPVLRGVGGPDAEGYVWIDSDEEGGPAFAWEDIAATGNEITGLTDENNVGPFAIGFDFNFYGNDFDEFWVSANGVISFEDKAFSFLKKSIPTDKYDNFIAWFWDDLNGTGKTAHYAKVDDHLIIQFDAYTEYGSTGGNITAQVVLYENGNIAIRYKDEDGMDLDSQTIGIQGADDEIGLQVAFNTEYVSDNKAILFSKPSAAQSFIASVSPIHGTVAPGEDVVLDIVYTSTGLEAGDYSEIREITSNDPENLVVATSHTLAVRVPAVVSGTVTDAETNAALIGVEVTAVEADVEGIPTHFTTVTDKDGKYSVRVNEGSYEMSFAHTEYQTSVSEVVAVEWAATATVDAQLSENANAPFAVNAEANGADDQVAVTWTLGGDYEIVYDDGEADNATAWAMSGSMNAVKFTPAGLPCTVIGGSVNITDGAEYGDFLQPFDMVLFNEVDGKPGTELERVTVDPADFWTVDNTWIPFEFHKQIEEGNFFIAMAQGGNAPNCAPIAVDETAPKYRSYSKFEDGNWMVAGFQDFMIRAKVNGTGGTPGLTKGAEVIVPAKLKQQYAMHRPVRAKVGVEGEGKFVVLNNNSRAAESFKVYRLIDGEQENEEAWTFLSDVSVPNYTDTEWENMAQASYVFAVKAVYPNGDVSPAAFSQFVGKEMWREVTVNISTTDGLTAEGALVKLEQNEYPFFEYQALADADNQVVFDAVWVGDYHLTVALSGYDTHESDREIQDDSVFDIMLPETTFSPRYLYVDSLGYATWMAPAPFFTSFETVPAEGWTTYELATTGYNWTTDSDAFNGPTSAKHGYTGAGTAVDNWMVTPQLRIMDGALLNFFEKNASMDYYTHHGVYVSTASNDPSTGDFELVEEFNKPADVWTNRIVDLSDYAGQDIYIGFRYEGEDGGDWMIDDAAASQVRLINNLDRAFVGYNVYLDDILQITTNETAYQYQNLNIGQYYTAKVSALYSSGQSDPATYVFQYLGYSAPSNLQATICDTPDDNNVCLTWKLAIPGAGDDFTEGFEESVPPANWTTVNTNGEKNWHQEGTISFSSGDVVPHEGEFQAAVSWAESAQDEWLKTPEFAASSNSSITFWSYTGALGSTHGDHYYVKISDDGGSTWNILWDAVENSTSASAYEEVTLDLGDYAGDVQLAWQAVDGDGAGFWFWWIIDDITVTADGKVLALSDDMKSWKPAKEVTTTVAAADFSRNGDVVANSQNKGGLDHFSVRRDGVEIATTTEMQYRDENVATGCYEYDVTAVWSLDPTPGFVESLPCEPVNICVNEKVITGTVSEKATGDPIADAIVTIGELTATTDNSGNYELPIVIGTYDVVVTADGYNNFTEEYTVSTHATYDIEMTRPILRIEPDVLAETFVIDETTLIKGQTITIYNDGDGVAEYIINMSDESKVAQLPIVTGGAASAVAEGNDISRTVANRETGDLQFSFDVDTPSGLTGLAGAECDGEFFYITKWKDSSIAKFDLEGNFVETFSISGVSGLRDLAFDGQYFYGSNASTSLYEMDFTNKTLVSTISSPSEIRAIAYDKGQDGFWVNNWDSDLTLVGRDGSVLDVISTPPSIYGMAYDKFSDGGPYLWLYSGTQSGGGCQVEQMRISDKTLTGTSYSVSGILNNADAIAGGCFVQEDIVEGTVTIGGIAQSTPDMLWGIELTTSGPGTGGGLDWLFMNAYTGTIEAGESLETTVFFKSTNTVGHYEGVIDFTTIAGTSTTIEAMMDISTGMNDLNSDAVAVYPVPAQDYVNIKLTSEVSEISVMNYAGQVVYAAQANGQDIINLNTSTYNAGMYFVQFIMNDGTMKTQKMVISE